MATSGHEFASTRRENVIVYDIVREGCKGCPFTQAMEAVNIRKHWDSMNKLTFQT